MKLNVSRLHYPVTALGPGRRAGIWVQGCTLACPGCVSRDTWSHEAGTRLPVAGVLQWLTDICAGDQVDGLTISGGEPTEQPKALHLLLQGVAELRQRGVFSGDILCYTGLDEADVREKFAWAPAFIDALITGRFKVDEPTSLIWRGSANQRLIPLSPRGQQLYQQYLDATTSRPPLQFTVADGQIWMIGIPRRGDLKRLESTLRDDGVFLEEVSWRPQ
jgi:anaerobic ribonucleoside-triphosphate reductase activating protein